MVLIADLCVRYAASSACSNKSRYTDYSISLQLDKHIAEMVNNKDVSIAFSTHFSAAHTSHLRLTSINTALSQPTATATSDFRLRFCRKTFTQIVKQNAVVAVSVLSQCLAAETCLLQHRHDCCSKNVDCASNKLSLASKGSTERNYDKTACFTDPQWLRLLKAWDILQIKRCDVVS